MLRSIPEGANYLYHTPKGAGERVFGYRRRYWSFLLKLAKDRPSWTIPAQPAQNAGPFHWDNRRLSEKEMLRLQSSPSKWHLAGGREERVRQIGNATPPLPSRGDRSGCSRADFWSQVRPPAHSQSPTATHCSHGSPPLARPWRVPCGDVEMSSPIPDRGVAQGPGERQTRSGPVGLAKISGTAMAA